MRFEVPQFIEVEDKIFGPFTWKQFIYLAGGAGASITLFFLLPFLLFLLIAGPIVGLAGFLAFHRINNRPFSIFLESFFSYFTGNKLYLWKKEQQQTVQLKSEGEAPLSTLLPSKTRSISTLANQLELNTLQK